MAYSQSSAREIVGDTLPLAETFCVDEIVALMHSHAMLSTEARSVLAEKLRARSGIFSLEKMAVDTLTVLQEAVSDP